MLDSNLLKIVFNIAGNYLGVCRHSLLLTQDPHWVNLFLAECTGRLQRLYLRVWSDRLWQDFHNGRRDR